MGHANITMTLKKFLSLAERYVQNVAFHDMSEYVKKLGPDILRLVDNHFSPGSIYRLFAPQAFPMEKVVYLDSDIVSEMVAGCRQKRF